MRVFFLLLLTTVAYSILLTDSVDDEDSLLEMSESVVVLTSPEIEEENGNDISAEFVNLVPDELNGEEVVEWRRDANLESDDSYYSYYGETTYGGNDDSYYIYSPDDGVPDHSTNVEIIIQSNAPRLRGSSIRNA
jgi:hypothetical protein